MDAGVVSVVRLGSSGQAAADGDYLPPPPFWNYTRIGEVDGTDGVLGGPTGREGDDCLDHNHPNAPRFCDIVDDHLLTDCNYIRLQF